MRCWQELTRIKISHLSQEALAALDEAYIASIQPKRQDKAVKPAAATPVETAPPVPKLSPEEEAKRDRARRIEEMIRKGRLEPLKALYARNPEDFSVSDLALAASIGDEEIVQFFLLSTAIDPATPLSNGKRAYEVAAHKGVRNVFRRVAHEHPDKYDWEAAWVPSGLSEEAEAAQQTKKNERRKGLRDKMKERQAVQAAKDLENGVVTVPEEAQKPVMLEVEKENKGPQRLGGARPGAAGEGLAGLSGETRAQIERERRARAAEARFKTST